MIFDAVYVLKKQHHERVNLLHPLLDFYDESFELGDYCPSKVVVLVPDKLQPWFTKLECMDMREHFVIDGNFYEGKAAPVIIRIMHARLRQANCLLFDLCYQTLMALLTTASSQIQPKSPAMPYIDQAAQLY